MFNVAPWDATITWNEDRKINTQIMVMEPEEFTEFFGVIGRFVQSNGKKKECN